MEDLLQKILAAAANPMMNPLILTEAETKKIPELMGQAFGSGKIDPSTAQLRELVKTDQAALEQVMSNYYTSPQGQKAMKETMRLKAKGRFSEQASEGLDFLTSFAEIASTMSNIGQANKDLAAVTPPTAPVTPGANPNLTQAVDMARERAMNPYASSEVNALLGSQAMDTLGGLQTAKQVSGGQASNYQANAQDVIDRSRFGKIQAAGVLQEGVRKAEGDFTQAAGLQSRETLQRAGLQQQLYGMQSRNYAFDKGMADAALSAQRGNLMTSLQNAEVRLPNAIGGGAARMYSNNNNYSGLGQNFDSFNNYQSMTANRLRNMQFMQGDYGSTGSLATTFSQ